MTGSDGEPAAMAARARDQGVPSQAIAIDSGGVRTLESCSRARQSGITSALLVSQRFHLPRALALCRAVGIDADGVGADRSRYSARARTIWSLREVPASWVAFVETILPRTGWV
jgi:vancomycin permeability regulator SanA